MAKLDTESTRRSSKILWWVLTAYLMKLECPLLIFIHVFSYIFFIHFWKNTFTRVKNVSIFFTRRPKFFIHRPMYEKKKKHFSYIFWLARPIRRPLLFKKKKCLKKMYEKLIRVSFYWIFSYISNVWKKCMIKSVWI